MPLKVNEAADGMVHLAPDQEQSEVRGANLITAEASATNGANERSIEAQPLAARLSRAATEQAALDRGAAHGRKSTGMSKKKTLGRPVPYLKGSALPADPQNIK